MRILAILLACLPAGAMAADILAARYDPASDELVVDIAYRGTHSAHEFYLEPGPCRDGASMAARLIDRQGGDAARHGFRVRERFALAELGCRPSRVTLRLGRVSHASVSIPEMPEAQGLRGFQEFHQRTGDSQ